MIAPRPSAADFSAAGFNTSTFTNGSGQCVEVSGLPGWAAVRDSKHRAGGMIVVPGTALQALLTDVKSGTFDCTTR